MSNVIVSGNVEYQGRVVRWELLAEGVSFLANTRGVLMLSCPETVLEFDWCLKPMPRPWEEKRLKVTWEGNEPLVHVQRRGEWVPVLRLSLEPEKNSESSLDEEKNQGNKILHRE